MAEKTESTGKPEPKDKGDEGPNTFDALVTEYGYTPNTASIIVDFLDQLHSYIHTVTENRYYTEVLGRKVVVLNDELEALLLAAHQAEFEENVLRAHLKATLKHKHHAIPPTVQNAGKTLGTRVNDLAEKTEAIYRKVIGVNEDIQNQHRTKR